MNITRVFSYLDADNQPRVGVEWQGRAYNFTLAWELYKQIQLNNEGPVFQFVQLIIEMDLFHSETFDELFETIQQFRSISDLVIKGDPKVKVPIERPQKIICVGRNYREHAEELQHPVPEEPIFFCKSPSAMIPSGEAIRLPKHLGRVDHEGELAVVIGKRGADIDAAQAKEYIAGFTIVNDVTARELQQRDKEKGLPWFRAKSFDTFCPMGPFLVPYGSIDNPQDLQMTVRVNNEVRQSATTAEMLTPIDELIAYVSRHLTLVEGDIIATGTPAGVSRLHKGDVVCVEIQHIGLLENKVV